MTCAVVGMAALSVTIIGSPLTMSFLVLEATGDYALSILILATTTLDSVLVRRTFGYSFATWRLHLRGESRSTRRRTSAGSARWPWAA